jgi:outer membrane protein assembly factor BamB
MWPVLAALFLLFVSALSGAAESSQDWPQFLGPHANGISEETGLLDRWPANGPALVWEKSIGTGYGAPSVLGQRLVLHHRIGDEEMVECLRRRHRQIALAFQLSQPFH